MSGQERSGDDIPTTYIEGYHGSQLLASNLKVVKYINHVNSTNEDEDAERMVQEYRREISTLKTMDVDSEQTFAKLSRVHGSMSR